MHPLRHKTHAMARMIENRDCVRLSGRWNIVENNIHAVKPTMITRKETMHHYHFTQSRVLRRANWIKAKAQSEEVTNSKLTKSPALLSTACERVQQKHDAAFSSKDSRGSSQDPLQLTVALHDLCILKSQPMIWQDLPVVVLPQSTNETTALQAGTARPQAALRPLFYKRARSHQSLKSKADRVLARGSQVLSPRLRRSPEEMSQPPRLACGRQHHGTFVPSAHCRPCAAGPAAPWQNNKGEFRHCLLRGSTLSPKEAIHGDVVYKITGFLRQCCHIHYDGPRFRPVGAEVQADREGFMPTK